MSTDDQIPAEGNPTPGQTPPAKKTSALRAFFTGVDPAERAEREALKAEREALRAERSAALRAEHEAVLKAEREAALKAKIQWTPEKTARLPTAGPRATFEHLTLSTDGKAVNGHPVKGAMAQVDVGGQGSRTTATRVVVGTILAPGVGTIVGAVAKKNRGMVYVTVTLASGHVLSAESKVKNESAARRFANAVNAASRR